MSGGYDIGLSASSSATSAANQNSPFQVTGGGGRAANYTTLIVIGGSLALAAFVLWLIFGKRK